MAAKHGLPPLRKLMERARGLDASATKQRGEEWASGPRGEEWPSAPRGGAVEAWPGQYSRIDPEYALYTGYADPHAEVEREFMMEAREIMGLDQELGD